MPLDCQYIVCMYAIEHVCVCCMYRTITRYTYICRSSKPFTAAVLMEYSECIQGGYRVRRWCVCTDRIISISFIMIEWTRNSRKTTSYTQLQYKRKSSIFSHDNYRWHPIISMKKNYGYSRISPVLVFSTHFLQWCDLRSLCLSPRPPHPTSHAVFSIRLEKYVPLRGNV